MNASDPAALNAALSAFTDVQAVAFATDLDGTCRLSLTLSATAGHAPATLQLTCADVSGLSLQGFGGGITQILCLRCSDVRARQHDRVNFEFADLENNVIAFRCRSFAWSVLSS